MKKHIISISYYSYNGTETMLVMMEAPKNITLKKITESIKYEHNVCEHPIKALEAVCNKYGWEMACI